MVSNGIQTEVGFTCAEAYLDATLTRILGLHVLLAKEGKGLTTWDDRVRAGDHSLGAITDGVEYREIATRGGQTGLLPTPLVERTNGYVGRQLQLP